MKRIAVGLMVVATIGVTGVAAAQAAPARGELMKACMAEWRVKSKAPGAEKLKYTAFLSECLKRRNAAVPAPR